MINGRWPSCRREEDSLLQSHASTSREHTLLWLPGMVYGYGYAYATVHNCYLAFKYLLHIANNYCTHFTHIWLASHEKLLWMIALWITKYNIPSFSILRAMIFMHPRPISVRRKSFFYRAPCNADGFSEENSVCPSVRLSVCPSVCHTRVL